MPSEKILQSKKELVEQLVNKCKNAVAGVLVDYKGIDVAKDTALRKELREANVEYFVVKNTMLRFAFKEVGFDALDEQLNGTTALAISNEDPISAAKIIAKYADMMPKEMFNIKAVSYTHLDVYKRQQLHRPAAWVVGMEFPLLTSKLLH